MFSLLLRALAKSVPEMSETERVALAAGDVWLDGELFSGRPDFRRFLDAAYPSLTERERAFLDGPVEEVCRRVDPREVAATRRLPDDAWELLRRHRFFGLGLPEAYGGHAFSALVERATVARLAAIQMDSFPADEWLPSPLRERTTTCVDAIP
ncbi:MAG TPA: acyl-CoA dehydrogenase family protein [Thermoanaerobaculia bacterium]|jgi:acyl-CoA dehydrogenase